MVRIKGYHKRSRTGKRHFVNSYNQNRKLNRGRKGKLQVNRKGTGTYWLKGNKGLFVGRADSDMETRTRKDRIRVLGKDTTNINQEIKPARIYGRTKGVTKSKRFF